MMMVAIEDEPIRAASRAQALRVWARIGMQSFGGPAGQIATMHRILIDELGWVSEQRFLDALNFCNLLPGPEAQQLATYLGWVQGGIPGALIAGGLFILPGLVTLLALSSLYVAGGSLPLVAAVFAGMKPAVLAVVVTAVIRIGRRALAGPWSVALAVTAFVALFVLRLPFPLVIVGAALAGVALRGRIGGVRTAVTAVARPSVRASLVTVVVGLAIWWAPLVAVRAAFGPDHVLAVQGRFFSQAALLTFGGAYAVLSYVSQEAVHRFAWLSGPEMIDGLALAETTPGPLILVLQFVGFLAGYRLGAPLSGWWGGLAGSLVTIWATFVPSFLLVLAGAPYLEWIRGLAWLQTALVGVTAAVVGVVANLSAWFAERVLFREQVAWAVGPVRVELPVPGTVDPLAVVVALVALVALQRFKVGMLTTLAGAAAIGVAAALIRSGPLPFRS